MITRAITANGISRKLARKVVWSVAMSTEAYGIEAIWEGQELLLDGFNKLTAALGRAVVRTFGTARGEDAIRAADIPSYRTGPRQKARATPYGDTCSPEGVLNAPSPSRRQRTTRVGTASPGGSQLLPTTVA